ncbi:MAG TPA: lytic transglycosylase domain-containing protein [Peptococcaceae bacterium]|nr:lytic transglycosylase domain-containing protein [Peptococcaceae bacterium]
MVNTNVTFEKEEQISLDRLKLPAEPALLGESGQSEKIGSLEESLPGEKGVRATAIPQTTPIELAEKAAVNENLNKLAQMYNAEPEYLAYIVEVEKKFNLEPCELLAVIAQESGFKPQTRMDGGSLSYSTTQMKMPTAITSHMAITEYYKFDIPYPTHELLNNDKKYAAFLAGGYLRYLHDTYQDKYESYTAYNWGIGGRMTFYNKYGHFKSPYALKIANLAESFRQMIGEEYYV